MFAIVSRLIESLLGRLFQRVSVEVLRHADALCTQARARRDLETLELAEALEHKGAEALAKDLRDRVQAEEMLRLPALNAEVEQLLLLPAAGRCPPPAAVNGNGKAGVPLPLPAPRVRKPRRAARAGAEAGNGTPEPTPAGPSQGGCS